MSVTYVGDLSTDRDRVRFYIGDTVADAGPKPEDENFSDEELDGLIAVEGSWQRAVAAAFETLAALWAKHTTFNADGMSAQQSDIAALHRAAAADWRSRYGIAGTATCGSRALTRADAYSSDLDNLST